MFTTVKHICVIVTRGFHSCDIHDPMFQTLGPPLIQPAGPVMSKKNDYQICFFVCTKDIDCIPGIQCFLT